MSYYGSWAIDDVLTFHCVTHRADTGAATAADSAPTYRVYEDSTTTAILNGTFTAMDQANTTSGYYAQITLSAANGFEAGKEYAIFIKATVNSVVGAEVHNFQVLAKVNSTTSVTIGAGSITSSSFAAGAINAAAIADGAIDRATFAADTGLQSIRSNTAQAGANGSITLDASASATNDFYKGAIVYLTGGTGAGQYRVINGYTGSSKVATVAPNWATNPDNTSTFAIQPRGMSDLEQILGVAVSTSTAQLGVNAVQAGGTAWGSGAITNGSIADDAITAAKIAANAIGASELASDAVTEISGVVAPAVWDVAIASHLTAGTTGLSLSNASAAGSPPSAAAIADAVWDELLSDHVGAGSTGEGLTAASVGLSAASIRSAVGLASANLDTQLSTIAGYVDTEVAAIKAKTDNLPSDPADASDIAASFASIASSIAALPAANDIADAYLGRADGIETDLTPKQAMRLVIAALAGKANGLETSTVHFRDYTDSKNRITATVDSNGNRSSITYDLT
jgi:hypothetical protein